MELIIKEQKSKPLFNKEQVTAELKFDGPTPSTMDIKKEIASKIKKDEKLVAVESIKTKFGERSAKVIANVYEKEEDLMKTEPKHVKRKNVPGFKIEKKGAPAEAKEEKPAAKAEAKGE